MSLLRRGDVRLVTLTGPGGVGKTRLAIETASVTSDGFPDGVRFVSLASLNDPFGVAPAIARSLGIHENGEIPLLEQLASSLRDRRILLVLDNFEHVSEAAPELAAMLGACPTMSMLVTSRSRLRLSGEWEYAVGPLGLPREPEAPSIAGDAHSASVQLFVQRASAADFRFSLLEGNLTAVTKICQRLAGLPLAIELAAARVKFLPPNAMLDHLENSLPVLKGGGPDMPARHRTMSDAIRWSYELLAPKEQAIFSRLAVFAGGFTVGTAEAVCTAIGEIRPEEVFDAIESLVAQSLVRPVESGSPQPRFTMLEPIRDFAREVLESSGAIEVTREAHARFYMRTVDREMPPFDARARAWIDEAKPEESNLLAALDWMVNSGNAALALRLGDVLVFLLWSPMVRYREQQFWLQRVLELPAPGLEAKRSEVVTALSWAEYCLGDADAALLSAEWAMDLATASGNASSVAWALTIKGLIDMDRRQYAAANDHLEAALEIARSGKDLLLLTSVLNRLCGVATMTQDYDRAMEFVEESLRISQTVGDAYGLVDAEETLATLLRHRGDIQAAAESGRKYVAASWGLGSEPYIAFALEGVVRYAVALGRFEQAARILGAASRFEQHSGIPSSRIDEEDHQRDLQTIRGALTEEEFAAAWTAGREISVAGAVAEADQVIAEWGESASSPPKDS